jgi:phosphoribosyl 1,2-cyclic phosphate phosphodiesterase
MKIMKLVILGSGGATTTPRPGCQCKICLEARTKGIPYARSGPSLFISDINLLFDTPEEIAVQLNREEIDTVDYIFYTHWHPDHTLGMRIIERMNKFWLASYVKREKPWKKVMIYALTEVLNDLKAIKNRNDSYFGYYEKLDLVTVKSLKNCKPVSIRDFEIVPFKVAHSSKEVSTVYLVKSDGRKIIYASCDVKPFPSDKRLEAADLLVIGNNFPEGPLKNNILIPKNNKLRKELFSFKEILGLIKKISAKRTLIVHIEEEWGK